MTSPPLLPPSLPPSLAACWAQISSNVSFLSPPFHPPVVLTPSPSPLLASLAFLWSSLSLANVLPVTHTHKHTHMLAVSLVPCQRYTDVFSVVHQPCCCPQAISLLPLNKSWKPWRHWSAPRSGLHLVSSSTKAVCVFSLSQHQ